MEDEVDSNSSSPLEGALLIFSTISVLATSPKQAERSAPLKTLHGRTTSLPRHFWPH
jgi:hypothetical protein